VVVAAGLDALGDAVKGADLVVSAVEADRPIISAATLADAGHDVLVIDLSVPRTVAHGAAEIPGVTLLDVAHLRDVVETALRERREEIAAAEAVVDTEVLRHLEARRERGAAPLVTALRARLETLRRTALEEGSGELASMTDAQREALDRLTKAIVARIAHDPTVALRASAGTDRGQRLADAARALFDL